MDSFRFAPELFELRTDVIAALRDAGFDWLSHYSAVDPLHDIYGLEVCGIGDRDDATAIQQVLIAMFPRWISRPCYYKDWGRDIGWNVAVHRDAERDDEQWEVAG